MNHLKTSRVVVIDDLPDEALPVIEAVGRLGIGCIYLTGERLEDLPKKPLRGIRLVVLDMRLGTSGGERQTASMTANVFRRAISADEGPLIVLLWTKHHEDIPAFQAALFDIEPKFRTTLLIADLEKPVTITAATLRKIERRIGALAREWAPMNCLWSWEQLAHDAATATTAVIANQVSSNAAIDAADAEDARKLKWLTALKRLMRTLAEAAGGRGASAQTAREDLMEALIAINDDRVEAECASSKIEHLEAVFEEPSGVNKNQAALLNGMVLVGASLPGSQELRPGNVYVLPARHGIFKPCGINVRALTSEILVHLDRDQEFKTSSDLVTKHKADAVKAADYTKAREKRRTQLYEQCRPVLAEITPSCDFTQRSRQVVRLAAGILVPVTLERLLPSTKDSLRAFEPVVLPGMEGTWRMVFSGRFLFTMTDPKECLTTRVAFRLRASVLADLRNWYASQASRPGYLSVSYKA